MHTEKKGTIRLKRRTKIRLASFLAAAITGLTAWGAGNAAKANRLEILADRARQRTLTELCTYLDSIETGLRKSVYTGAGMTLRDLAVRLHTDAAGAKTGLSTLDAGDKTPEGLYKFLSQVGEYTESLYKKTAAGGGVDEEDRRTLKRLLDTATALSDRFDHMNRLLDAGYFSFEEVKDLLQAGDETGEKTVSFIGAVADAEDGLTDAPSLIYDGPFSDNLLTKTSALLEGAREIGLAEARRIAANALDAKESDLISEGRTDGKLAAYVFRTDRRRAAVTRRGGYVSYVLSDLTAGEEKLTGSDAVSAAAACLKKLGYTEMVSTYYAADDGVCTVNFAYRQDGWICYPDLIKVSVSLADGTVVAMDAADYLMNHTQREIPAPGVDETTAREAPAPGLQVKGVKYAVIPTDGGGERFAYELFCDDGAGQDVLVYADAQTGEEADVLLLLYADGGTVTK